jgi:hypothetical protein
MRFESFAAARAALDATSSNGIDPSGNEDDNFDRSFLPAE